MFSWHIHIFFLEVILEGYASVVLVDLVFVFKVFILDFKESTLFVIKVGCNVSFMY